ncbi:restriction endonuclease [Tenacibaculum pacificus]|uniref:restriction endonuclease n=1 Tax=Tenacibaculum pacificus TaxID=3018314 RepID=UPI0022F3F467|nr:restriction endonuclease [Tenacibaculum pacificus]WBX72938.1 restriction endonuclease [Tenacibaculum pacificus]
MREQLRIPVFEKEFLFNIRNELIVKIDEPNNKWIDTDWRPENDGWDPDLKRHLLGLQYDSIAENEVFRLLKFRTCPYCRTSMEKLVLPENLGIAFVCKNCFYWGGRGTRPGGPTNTRGNLGRLNFISNPDDVKLELLINHLQQNVDRLYNLTPRQAEKLMPSVLSDYLKCEVKGIGGTKDGGIDALAILGENEKMIIQIKWREKKKGAEAVSVVREVGGTLLARKIPKGLIISTRKKFSKTAIEEANLISQHEIIEMGKIELKLNDFNDLIDMFNISSKIRNENLNSEEIIPYYNDGFELFGRL